MTQNVMLSPIVHPRTIVLRVTGGTPTVVEGGLQCTASKGGTGAYTFTFLNPFSKPPICQFTGVNAAATIVTITAVSVSAVSVLITNDAGVAADRDIQGIIFGSDSLDMVI